MIILNRLEARWLGALIDSLCVDMENEGTPILNPTILRLRNKLREHADSKRKS